ncbi:MAG: hydantoinase B/oxoprolinase family protein, partial [Deltaproteobacteria bacterium]|nr:hydantoinase B/oxoprolinase family protein [Deltaproteobacteria bacterium]
LFYLNGMFKVGPESAGTHPGPVCYRKNGYLTITDANLVLGRLQPDNFPHIFGPDEDQPLDLEASRQAFADLTKEINNDLARQDRQPMTIEGVAYGFIQVANEVMVRPIREISVLRGYDIKEHILATFGGAGPQHAVAIARALGIEKIFIHRHAGILSAYGMGLADVVIERQRPAAVIYGPKTRPELQAGLEELCLQAIEELQEQDFNQENISTMSYLNLRYQGTDTALMIAKPDDGNYDRALADAYQREFGFNFEQREIVVDDLRVRAVGRGSRLERSPLPPAKNDPQPIQRVKCYFAGGWQETPVYQLEKLGPGHTIKEPSLIMHDTATILVEPESTAIITEFGDIEITIDQDSEAKVLGTTVDPIQLSIFSNLFMSIAEQMGRTLQKTAISTNIKERLDFSCALFGPGGELVANAPHLPVHLGSMSEAVKAQIHLQNNNFKAGDVLVSNHPAAGGSHLPDITVITPVLQDGQPIFFVASRGHHADIGGISPGSMPPFSRRLEEEGACIMSFKLVRDGIFQQEGITALLQEPGNLPHDEGKAAISGTRALADNLSDLKAQVATNRKGIELIKEMIDRYSLAVVQAYMQHVQHSAEVAVRKSLKQLADSYTNEDQAVI